MSEFARANPNVVLLAVIATVVIGFSFYKFLTVGGSKPPANDQPAAAFQDPGVQQMVQNDFLQAPRLPADIYRRLSEDSAVLARRTLAQHLRPRYLRAAGETPAEIRQTLLGLAPTLRQVGGLKVNQRSPYRLTSVAGKTATIAADLLIFDPSGRRLTAPLNATLTFQYQARSSWNHAKLANITLSLGG